MVLSPLPITKVACALLAPAAALVAGALVVDPPVPVLSQAAALPLAVLAVVVLVRSPRLQVRCDSRGVTVHGILWSRTIPRHAVVAVTDWPAVTWRDADGRRRWTPITFLPISGRVAGFVLRHNQNEIARLRTWTH
ncbi:hypothetical protein ACUN7V_17085 [Quadrisphaera oryzae]|uniref:hypothetical protein n=1 Tax=Quadrisphaera TaxID=317661 RepID=UPI001645EAE5|nr:hypothetical protein [Quadrisphaera sp. RL12-1S]MBC3761830.1 hypothetical protein [Quadrisphaera sp. RL12-1S]